MLSVGQRLWVAAAALVFSVIWGGVVGAQELTPRAYWPGPDGMNVLVLGYAYSAGDIVTDPTLPVIGTDSRSSFFQAGMQRNLSLAGRSASFLIVVPYVVGTTKAASDYSDAATIIGTRHLSGFGDTRLRLAVNLLGAPRMDMAGFQELRSEPRPILGASVQVSVPTGAYESDRVINVGANRWAFKADIGYMHPIRRVWQLELDIGVWFFTDNDDFLGQTREQRPILAGEVHLVRNFRRGIWASLDWNYYVGGRTTIADELKANLQRNSRLGGTLLLPIHGGHAAKVTFSVGAFVRAGGDFTTLQFNYQFAWM